MMTYSGLTQFEFSHVFVNHYRKNKSVLKEADNTRENSNGDNPGANIINSYIIYALVK